MYNLMQRRDFMTKIVDAGLKVDFHIHSYYSRTKDSENILNRSKLEDIPTLISKLNENKIQMCAITDHDVFNYEIYKRLKEYENSDNSTLKKVLPGVEFTVSFKRDGKSRQLHVIALFSDEDELKVKEIERVLELKGNKPQYDLDGSSSEEQFIKLLSDINLDTVLIVHQKQTLYSKSTPKKNDANSVGEDAFNEFVTSEYFEAYEFKNKKNELFNNLATVNYGKDLLRFITGSDCHDWTVYPKHDKKSNDDNMKFTYFKCLPTFKGVVFALTDYTRISLVDNFFTADSNNYFEEIRMRVNGNELTIPLSRGINVIIGDNSVGKSLLLHKLTGYYRENESTGTSTFNSSIKKGYEKYLEDNHMSVETLFDRNKIYEFDTQGEIRQKFNLQKMKKTTFLKDKYPPDVDVTEPKQICLEKIDYVCNYLINKFQYDEKKANLNNLKLLKNDVNATNVTYIKCENIYNEEIEKNTKITQELHKSKESIKVLCELIDDESEKGNLKKIINYLEKLSQRYKKENYDLSVKVKVINSINIVFNDISNRHELIQTTESQTLTSFLNQKEMFENSIVDIYDTKQQPFNLNFSMEPINITYQEYPYLSYKFVKRTKLSVVNEDYLIEMLSLPLKKGFQLENLGNITREELIDKLKNYDEDKNPSPIEFYKEKCLKKVDEDLKSISAIIKENDSTEISYSDGINSQIYFDIICGDKYTPGIYLIDQPEDDISPYAIKSRLLDEFKKMSRNRQIILVTHNPQFVVNLDADNVIVIKKQNGQLSIKSGALEYYDLDTNIINSVADTLDGGIDSIKKRWKRYEKDVTNSEN